MSNVKPTKTKKTKSPHISGINRQKRLVQKGIHPQKVSRMVDQGILMSIARGVYMDPGAPITEFHDLAIVSARVPHAVICLVSALSFHGMTLQIPRETWIAIANRAAKPRLTSPATRVVYLTAPYFSAGVEKHLIEGVPTQIYCAAKTVADCFKFRNKIGIDVAIEALRDYLRLKKGTVDDLWRFARMGRVAKVMQPYLEASV